jgi:uncharacterized membrane protein YhfC
MSTKRWLTSAVLVLTLFCAAGCSPAAEEPGPVAGDRVTGATLDEESAGSTSLFAVHVESPGTPIGIDFRGTLVQGSARAELLTPEGTVYWERAFSELGPFAVNTVVEPPTAGDYPLQVAWDGPVQAVYNLRWQPGEIEVPVVQPVVLLAGIGMVLVAVAYIVYAALHHLGWAYLGLGAAAWVGSVIVKFAWAIPINPQVYGALTGALPGGLATAVFSLYVGSLTGVFEVLGVWLLLRYTKLGRATWGRALAFGIGFGAFEALWLGISSFASVLTAILAPATLPIGALEQIVAQSSAPYLIAPPWERFFTVLVHAATNLLLFYALARRQVRWLWAAFVYKTAIDTVAAWAQLSGLVASLAGVWAVETVVALLGIAGWVVIRSLEDRYPQSGEAQAPA